MSFLQSTGWIRLAYFMSFAGFVVLQLLHLKMISEINGRLPKDSHVPYGCWAPGDRELYNLHKQFFPESKLSRAIDAVILLWCPFFGFAISRVVHICLNY